MRKTQYLVILVIFLVACSSNQNGTVKENSGSTTKVAKSVQETIQALDISGSAELPLSIPTPTQVIATAKPTKTAFPTFTPRPEMESVAEVVFDPKPKTIDNIIVNTLTEKVYSFPVITVTDVKAFPSTDYGKANEGETIIQVSVRMQNPGKAVAQYGSDVFKVFDSSGIGHEPNYSFDDCDLDFDTDVLPGGKLEGCLEFSIPEIDGKFVLTYAPYKIDKYASDRHLQWKIEYPKVAPVQALAPTIKATIPISLRTSLTNGWVYLLPGETIGEMQYIGEKPIGNITLKSVFYNDKGEIKEEVDGYSWQDSVLPGEKIVFILSTSWSMKNASNVDLTITADFVSRDEIPSIYREFELKNFQLRSIEGGSFKMDGEVINTGDRAVVGVGVYIIAYDKSGNIVSFDQATAGYEKSSFEPGQSSPVDGSMRINHPEGLSAVDHFEFMFEAYAW